MSEEEILDYDENIYQKLVRATAKVVDINLGKTTLADLLDGYTKSRVLEQENKQLKEELERSMKANIVLDNTNTDYASIIFDLEEYLKSRVERVPETMAEVYEDTLILGKIQELKEKYK